MEISTPRESAARERLGTGSEIERERERERERVFFFFFVEVEFLSELFVEVRKRAIRE